MSDSTTPEQSAPNDGMIPPEASVGDVGDQEYPRTVWDRRDGAGGSGVTQGGAAPVRATPLRAHPSCSTTPIPTP